MDRISGVICRYMLVCFGLVCDVNGVFIATLFLPLVDGRILNTNSNMQM